MKKNYRHLPVKSSSGYPVAILDVLSLARCAYKSLARHENAVGSTGRTALSIESGIAGAMGGAADASSVSSGEMTPKSVGSSAFQSGDVDGDEDEEMACVDEATSEAPSPPVELGEHEKNAVSMLLAGNFTGARKELSIALEEASGGSAMKRAALLSRRANVTSVLGDLEEAVKDYESALELLSGATGDEKKRELLADDSHFGLCEAMSEMGRHEFAGRHAKAIQSDTRKAEAYGVMAKEQARLKQAGNELYSSHGIFGCACRRIQELCESKIASRALLGQQLRRMNASTTLPSSTRIELPHILSLTI